MNAEQHGTRGLITLWQWFTEDPRRAYQLTKKLSYRNLSYPMSNLLIAETPHQVVPSLAVELGLNEAIFIQQLHWRIQNNECYYHDDRLWWYHSRKNWAEAFPYWSEETIKRIVKSLKQQKIITVEKLSRKLLNRNIDQTNWFAINYDVIDQISQKVALKKQAAIEEKTRKNIADKPIKIRGSDLLINKQNSSTGHVESPMGQNDPIDWVNVSQPMGQSDPMFYKNNKKSSKKREVAPTEPDFNFDLTLAFVLTICKQAGYDVDDVFEKAIIQKKISEYQKSQEYPTESGALSHVQIGLEFRHGTKRRGAKNAAARDNLGNAVVQQLETQAAVIDQHTKNAKQQLPKTTEDKLTDRSWAADLDFSEEAV